MRAWLLAAAVLLAACGAPASPPSTIAEARSAWASSGTADYDFVIRRDCYCREEYVGPFAVSVRDGVATVTRSGAPVAPEILEGLPTDAAALFDFAATREGQSGFRADFDPQTGLPLSVWSDPIPEAADDELGLTISDLVLRP